MPSLGTLRPPSNNTRIWDGEVDGETIGKNMAKAGVLPRGAVGKVYEPERVFIKEGNDGFPLLFCFL